VRDKEIKAALDILQVATNLRRGWSESMTKWDKARPPHNIVDSQQNRITVLPHNVKHCPLSSRWVIAGLPFTPSL
jgi:hypothetical protein